MNMSAVPPELIGVLQASTISDEDKSRVNEFFANLDPNRRPDVMREVRSRGNWQDKIRYVLEQASS